MNYQCNHLKEKFGLINDCCQGCHEYIIPGNSSHIQIKLDEDIYNVCCDINNEYKIKITNELT